MKKEASSVSLSGLPSTFVLTRAEVTSSVGCSRRTVARSVINRLSRWAAVMKATMGPAPSFMADRLALDTLIDAGVARSRSEALAWCVRLVAQHQEEWIQELSDAMTAVEGARNRGFPTRLLGGIP
jgi:hypothetical protein